MISTEGVGDAVRDGLRGANHSNSLAIARICNVRESRPEAAPAHPRGDSVNTFLQRPAPHCIDHFRALAQCPFYFFAMKPLQRWQSRHTHLPDWLQEWLDVMVPLLQIVLIVFCAW